MDWQDRIEKMPGVLSGKPIIKGMRLSVEQIAGHLKVAFCFRWFAFVIATPYLIRGRQSRPVAAVLATRMLPRDTKPPNLQRYRTGDNNTA